MEFYKKNVKSMLIKHAIIIVDTRPDNDVNSKLKVF
jgi:hypothetical protein